MAGKIVVPVAAAVLLVAGCSGSDEPLAPATVTSVETATVTATATVTRDVETTVTETVEVTRTVTAAAEEGDEGAELSGDVTEAFVDAHARYPWVSQVVVAEMTSDSQLTVGTTLVDPRGADGSEPALVGVDICRAAVDWLEGQGVEASVWVMEADGSTFVLKGNSTGGVCMEQ